MLLQQEFNRLLQPFFILLLKRQICGKWTLVDTVTGLYSPPPRFKDGRIRKVREFLRIILKRAQGLSALTKSNNVSDAISVYVFARVRAHEFSVLP